MQTVGVRMSNAGIFFALTALELASMQESVSQGTYREWVDAAYTQRSEHAPSRMLNVDAAWDAIHRCLGDGSLNEDPTDYPLRAVILGGKPVGHDEGLIMRLNEPTVVQHLSDQLRGLDERAFRSCYFSIDADSYLMTPNEGDFQYTWTYFQQVQSFYHEAAERGDDILFVAYQ